MDGCVLVCVCVCMLVCVCVCVLVCVRVDVVAVWCSGCVLGSGPQVPEFKPNSGIFFHLIFYLPPTSPTSQPSCDWVPGICWGANSRPFFMQQQWSRWDFGCPHHLL